MVSVHLRHYAGLNYLLPQTDRGEIHTTGQHLQCTANGVKRQSQIGIQTADLFQEWMKRFEHVC